MEKTIELSTEARKSMSRHPEIDWPRVASQAIESVAHALEADDDNHSSRLPRTQALCESIKRGIRRRHEAALGAVDDADSSCRQ